MMRSYNLRFTLYCRKTYYTHLLCLHHIRYFLQNMNYHSIGNSIKSSETLVDEGVFHVLLLPLPLNPFIPMQKRFATPYYCLINRLDLLVLPTIWNIDCLQIAGRNCSSAKRRGVSKSIMKAVFHMKIREGYESKLGDVIYPFALYKRVKRASILLNHPDSAVLTLSFDRAADQESISWKNSAISKTIKID